MRFMVLVKADANSEAGVLPTREELAEMGRYNQQLVSAGVLLAADSLRPTDRGTRLRFTDGEPERVEGPFPEPESQLAGFWIIHARSHEEAVEWARRIPFRDGLVEVRQVMDADDFGEQLSAELQAQEAVLRTRIIANL
jgi:hypothetical protein